MPPAGGMFLSGDVDLERFDSGFFEVSGADIVAMDSNQRQMLEVVYEALENTGIPLEQLDVPQLDAMLDHILQTTST